MLDIPLLSFECPIAIDAHLPSGGVKVARPFCGATFECYVRGFSFVDQKVG